MVHLLAAAIAASIPTTPPSYPPLDASPAMWVVNDHDTIIYLFGTFHALDGRAEWFNDEVLTAFSGSDELVLETVLPRRGSNARAMPPLAGSSSFLSTTKLVMSVGRTQGMSTKRGADAVLREAAENTGKPVGGLESLQTQLEMFNRLPVGAKPATTAQKQQAVEALPDILARLQAAWVRGDTESFAPMLETMRLKTPEAYRLMFVERNSRWAQWIDHRLQRPGTVFIAVGAGHLAGQDSVQAKLAQLGVSAARIN